MKTTNENTTAATGTPGQSPDAILPVFQSVHAHARRSFSQSPALSRRAARLSRFFPLSSR
jgi:predicted amidophosphoribosyltransferase